MENLIQRKPDDLEYLLIKIGDWNLNYDKSKSIESYLKVIEIRGEYEIRALCSLARL